ncbi:rhomboid family intramembrane serine protease [Terracidiphilus gabretensis]|jgi:membrane associated rhomboid family serine protease|uniref:rhomboid family intramembrane serine protease n=1 Tax=Terracidiphilus gabretensis TaxID=1577687 RepID=UPI00071C1E4C|nr:rhomboid family intramembrane serine protease [Terracidiphilus gabretensis]
MPRMGQLPLAFPDFSGATRRLVLINLAAFFALLILNLAHYGNAIVLHLALTPTDFLSGRFWQPFTYSLVHPALLNTLLELLSLWFLASFLESHRGSRFVTGLYIWSVLGTAAAAILLEFAAGRFGFDLPEAPLAGCMGAVFGMLIAIGVLFGDVQFLMFFVIGIKAKYLAAIYALITFATLFGQNRLIAFAQIGGALAALLYIRLAPARAGLQSSKRGIGFSFSERWYALRNNYYRWKRRRAGRKFEVYMKKQGRTVRLDSRGRQIDDDDDEHNNRGRWN